MSFARMSYVLEQTKQQQVLALGQLGWTVSRITSAVGIVLVILGIALALSKARKRQGTV